ncbi:MAG: EAL domain-containing protein [Sulfurimonas sp.]
MKNINLPFDTIDALAKAVQKNAIEDGRGVLIQLFCAFADRHYIQNIQTFFKNEFPLARLIGTTTDGVINGDQVCYQTKSIATFTLFEDTKLEVKLFEHEKKEAYSFHTGQNLAHFFAQEKPKAIICFADGITTNGDNLIDGIESLLPNVILAGGLAGDNGKLQETLVFDKENIVSKGVVAAALYNPKMCVNTGYTFNWTPIGKKMRVTKADYNRVYELDGMPIVDVYKKYMGKELTDGLPQVGIEFPLIVEKEDSAVGRAVLAKHDDGSLSFAGNIDEYETVRFGVGDTELILNEGTSTINKFLTKYTHKYEAIYIYSCMARRRFLEENITKELEPFTPYGDPSGFYTYGEFVYDNGKNKLLNQTMSFLALSEKCLVEKEEPQKLLSKRSTKITTQHVLANLANTISNELAELNERLEERVRIDSTNIYKQAYIDELTDLPNRNSLINALEHHTGETVLLINVDDFSTINDFYGHVIGGQILKKVASMLQHCTQKYHSKVYKLPADEFAIILNLKYNTQEIERYVKLLINKMESIDYNIQNHSIHIGVTVSAAMINSLRTGLINADMALKLAKKKNKSYLIYNEELQLSQRYEQNIKIANLIKYALQQNQIIPYYQAIVDVHTLKVCKYEALVRLKQNDKTVLSPYQFLEVSRKIRLYENITRTMIEQTFALFSTNSLHFSLNLDFDDMADPKIRDFLFQKIEEYDIADQLTIEILETHEFEDISLVYQFVAEVYAHGAKIAIDDFGSGYANFEYLTSIRSDFIKIDGTLIQNIDKDPSARAITEQIIGFAKKLGKKVIAEFVHSEKVFEIVKELGVDCAQGYYFAEPKESIETL